MSKDVAALAWIEHQIISTSSKNGDLDRAAQAVAESYGLETGYFGHGILLQPRLLALFYLLVVYPRELWKQTERENQIEKLLDWDVNFLPGECFPNGAPSGAQQFIRHVRNGVSHARISITDRGVEIWDVGRDGKECFRVSLTLEQTETFLSAVGQMFSNYRSMRLQ